MILGTGIDLCEIARMEKAVQAETFVRRVFTASERAYAAAHNARPEVYAGMYAAKEAVAKALGTGVSGFAMTDIEILHRESGAPSALLHGLAAALAGSASGALMHISISHDGGFAVAQAVWESAV